LKLIKLLNSFLFEDSAQNVNNWLSWMQNKLKINKNHFSIEKLKIAYIESWVSEAAIKHIASCMQNICYERAQSSTETCVLWASLDSIEPSAHLLSVHIVFASHRSRSLALNSRLSGLFFVYLYLYDLL